MQGFLYGLNRVQPVYVNSARPGMTPVLDPNGGEQSFAAGMLNVGLRTF
ncbi:MAG: hypothetical protein ACJA1J_002093 [Sulfitobacter pontiacus]|jgi:hypothetical protein